MQKLLYIDIPFTDIQDGGANRSKFLWESLCKYFQVDWLEVYKSAPSSGNLPTGCNNHYKIKAFPERRFWQPQAINKFSSSAKKEFKQIIKKNDYKVIFYRFLSPVRLAKIVRNINEDIIQVVDVDMLMSRLNKLSWQQEKSIRNRYYLLESLKLEKFENFILNKPYLYLLTNKEEAEFVKKEYCLKKNNIDVLPNVMVEKKEIKTEKSNRILFFGTLSSAANSDALQFISEEIYPYLEPVLEKHNLTLDIAGRGWKDSFKNIFTERKRLRYLGEVDDIDEEIAKSIIVFLPLRIASGTRTRILEAANQSAAVITTKIGVEGLDLGEKELMIRDDPQELVNEVKALIENENRRIILGQQLRLKSRALYLAENVSEQLFELIQKQR